MEKEESSHIMIYLLFLRAISDGYVSECNKDLSLLATTPCPL